MKRNIYIAKLYKIYFYYENFILILLNVQKNLYYIFYNIVYGIFEQ